MALNQPNKQDALKALKIDGCHKHLITNSTFHLVKAVTLRLQALKLYSFSTSTLTMK